MKKKSLIPMAVGLIVALLAAGMILKFMDRTPDADQTPVQPDTIIEEEIIEIPAQSADMNAMDMNAQEMAMAQDEIATPPQMLATSVYTVSTPADVELMAQDQGASVIKFYAPWCGACQYVDQYYGDLPAEFNGAVTFYSVDVGNKKVMDSIETLGLTTQAVEYLPTFAFRMNGSTKEQITGAKDKAEFMAFIGKVFNL